MRLFDRELHGTPMERPRVRQRLSHAQRSGVIPPMPSLILGDMQERHGDLQEAMNVGNSGKIFELTSMLSNAAEDGRDDSRSVNAIMIEERRHSHYGLRRVRIGEAPLWAPIVASVSRRVECTMFRLTKVVP